MKTLKAKLENIYNANQCMDLSDVSYALSEVMELVSRHDWTPALRRRVISLEKRREVLQRKER